jgi:hypothetical protein
MIDIKKLRDLDKDDLLNLIGLQTKRTTVDWILPTLGIFGVGVLVGAGIGMLLAPKPGRELREDLRNRLQAAADDIGGPLSEAPGRMEAGGTSSQRPL